MTLEEAYRYSINTLKDIHEKEEAARITELLFEDIFGISKLKRITNGQLPFNEQQHLDQLLLRLTKGEPYQHIVGYTRFCDKKILVSKSVLIPRPETEELFYWMKERRSKVKTQVIADICTGSGCLAIAARAHFQEAHILACDISYDALEKSIMSERFNFISNSIEWFQMNILNESWTRQWPDVVISNPPYILESESEQMSRVVLDYEPHIALFAKGKDPLIFYKRIIELFSGQEMPEIYFEMNPLTAVDLLKFCEERQLEMEIGVDMSGKERFARINRKVG